VNSQKPGGYKEMSSILGEPFIWARMRGEGGSCGVSTNDTALHRTQINVRDININPLPIVLLKTEALSLFIFSMFNSGLLCNFYVTKTCSEHGTEREGSVWAVLKWSRGKKRIVLQDFVFYKLSLQNNNNIFSAYASQKAEQSCLLLSFTTEQLWNKIITCCIC
jgi:hypothetical protein